MQLDKDLISRLEKLARLQLTDAERIQFSNDLSRILDMVDKLKQLDTTGVEPLAYPTHSGSNMRKDEIGQQFSQENALLNAPKHDNQFFRVPKVID